jgi:hypothetical protein
MILTVRYNAMQLRRQLYVAAVANKNPSKEVSQDTLRSLITESLKEDAGAKEAHMALCLLGGRGPEHSVSASLLWHYQSHWSKQEGLLCYRTLLYVPAENGKRREILQQHHDDPIAVYFGAHCSLKLIARKYYSPSMLRNVMA